MCQFLRVAEWILHLLLDASMRLPLQCLVLLSADLTSIFGGIVLLLMVSDRVGKVELLLGFRIFGN